MKFQSKLLMIIPAVVLLASVFAVHADRRDDAHLLAAKDSGKAAEKPKRAPMADLTPKQEAAALAFVEKHHAEVVVLLEHLKKSKSPQYSRAIRELVRTSQRLGQQRDRDPKRYELELRAWKLKSQAQLLAARLTMSSDEQLEKQLRISLEELYDTRLEILQLSREQGQQRLAKIEEQISRLEQSRQRDLQEQLDALLRITAKKTKPSPANKPRQKTSAAKRLDSPGRN